LRVSWSMSSLDVDKGPTRMKWRSVDVLVRIRWGGKGWISPESQRVRPVYEEPQDAGRSGSKPLLPSAALPPARAGTGIPLDPSRSSRLASPPHHDSPPPLPRRIFPPIHILLALTDRSKTHLRPA
jgi:hypothetical protein